VAIPVHSIPVRVTFKPSGLGLIESHHDVGFFMEWRRDSFSKVLYIVNGKGAFHSDTGETALKAPSVCVIPAGMHHRISDHRSHPLSVYGFCLQHPDFPGPQLVQAALSESRVESKSPLTHRIGTAFRELLIEERLGQPESSDWQLAIVSRILVELIRTRPEKGFLMVESRARIEAYAEALKHSFWREGDLDVAAGSLGMSRRRFTQLFREVTGESWLEHVTRLRLEHAAELLEKTPLSARSIAFECGYADLSHFYRLFNAVHGTSPGQFRRLRASDR